MITEDNQVPTTGTITKQTITIVHGGTNVTGLGSAMMRLARQLQLQLLIERVSDEALEQLRAEGRGQRAHTVDDVLTIRSRDWSEWDRVRLSANCAPYERKNIALVQARRDCPHGHQVRERARRTHHLNVGWKRFSTRTRVRHERIRPRVGSCCDRNHWATNHHTTTHPTPQFEGRLRPTHNS